MKLKKSELKNQVLTALNLTTSKQVASWAKKNNLSVDLCYTAHWELVLNEINETSQISNMSRIHRIEKHGRHRHLEKRGGASGSAGGGGGTSNIGGAGTVSASDTFSSKLSGVGEYGDTPRYTPEQAETMSGLTDYVSPFNQKRIETVSAGDFTFLTYLHPKWAWYTSQSSTEIRQQSASPSVMSIERNNSTKTLQVSRPTVDNVTKFYEKANEKFFESGKKKAQEEAKKLGSGWKVVVKD